MKAKRDGLIIGLVTGAAVATLAYLSLSDSKKNLLLKESGKKLDDLNQSLTNLSQQLLNSASEKFQDSKENIDNATQSATETAEELFDKAKSTLDYCSEQADNQFKKWTKHK